MTFKFFEGEKKEEVIWRTHRGTHIPILWMTTRHIRNALNCLQGEGEMEIPNPYFGKSRSEWIRIFEQELDRR